MKKVVVKNLFKEFIIKKSYKKACNSLMAVNNISFSVDEGEIFCLLGNNGAGKTTTLRIIAGLLNPSAGSVIIDGITLNSNSTKYRNKIGFLTSELKLEDCFTPSFIFDFFGKMYGLSPITINERRAELFSALGVAPYEQKRIGTLSTGMKQKVSIAVALIHNPDVIVFDEPTNGLDLESSREVIQYLKMLKSEGKSIIISTHIFDIVNQLADKVGIMINGSLAFCGEYKENMDINELFFDLYDREKGLENGCNRYTKKGSV